jgi:dolichyl-diphosphooligosaccharide--protein glycosyltransferase
MLEGYSVDVEAVNDIMTHPSDYIQVVKDNPDIYGPYDSQLSAKNAMYAAAQVQISEIGQNNMVDLYHDLRETTGVDVGYFAIDGRLFPFTAFGFNIFYAPASLSDHRIDQFGQPVDFYQILAVDQFGETHTFDEVTPDMTIVDYTIEYKEMFYDCMLYKTFMGYGPSDIGYTEQGIPGISGSLAQLPPMQGWNLSHFKMVYRTVYYNPFPIEELSDHPEAWRAISLAEGIELQEKIDAGEIEGYVDFSASTLQSGVVFVQYYEGAIINGTATTESGEPYANACVTVLDEYDIPHMTVKTDENGQYEVLAPFGNISVVYSYGDLDLRTQVAAELKRVTHNISYSQSMKKKTDTDGDGKWDYLIDGDVVLQSSNIDGTVFWDIDGDGEYDPTVDEPMTDARVRLTGTNIQFEQEVEVNEDGEYLFPSVPPMNADLYAYAEDRTLGLSEQVIKPLGDRTVDIPVVPSGINGTLVNEYGVPVEGMTVQMEDMISGEVTNRTTGADGQFRFSMLLPGNYSLSLENTSLTIGEQVFNLRNSTVEREFTVQDSMTISGKVRVEGQLTPNVMVGAFSAGTEIWAVSDSTGSFTVTLPRSDYTIYSVTVRSGTQYAWLGQVSSGDQVTVNPDLERANVISGNVFGGGVPGEDVDVRFESRTTGATISVVTNDTGGFRASLPTDDYFVYSHTDTHAIWQDIFVTASKRVDLILSEAVLLDGMVWTDSDHNGLKGQHEGMSGVTISIQDMDGRELVSITNSTGHYDIVLVPGNTYYVSYESDGYLTVNREYEPLMESVTEDIELVPLNRTLEGITSFEGTEVDDVELRFIATGGGAIDATVTTDTHGRFTIPLAPGQYQVVVDQNVTHGDNSTRWRNTTDIDMVIGEDPEPLGMELVKRVRVHGTVEPDRGVRTDIIFDGPETVDVEADHTFDLYLIPGEYDIYAHEVRFDDDYAYLERMSIDESSSPITIETVEAKILDVGLEYDEGPFINLTPVSIVNETGETLNLVTDQIGTLETHLPVGEYTVIVDYPTIERVDEAQRYVRYTASRPVSLISHTTIDITLDRDYDNSTVHGFMYATSGAPVAGSLTFAPMSETAMDATVTATEGGFSLDLAPGNYTLYARQFEGTDAYLGMVEVLPYLSNELDVQLEAGLRFGGKTIYSGSQGPASMTISGDGSLDIESGIDGSYEVYLPAGSYSVSSTASTVEREMDVDYETYFDLELEQPTSRTIDLQKVLMVGVDVEWNDQEKVSVLPGETATYTVMLENTGNSKDTFSMEALYIDWDVEFSQDSVTLDFGTQNTAAVTVTINTPTDAKVDHGDIKIYARSSVDPSVSSTADVDVEIIPVRDVNLTFDKGYPTEGTNYSFEVKLTNQGNTDDTYNVTVSNPAQLESLGWTYAIGNTTSQHMEIEVAAGESEFFDVYMIPIRSNPDPDVELVLFVRSQSESTIQKGLPVTLNLPDVTIPDLSVTGTSVYDSAPAIPNGTIFLGGLVLVMFVIMILLGFQKGVFKRRKR